jgi:predicted NodU family carbamoyl transferase
VGATSLGESHNRREPLYDRDSSTNQRGGEEATVVPAVLSNHHGRGKGSALRSDNPNFYRVLAEFKRLSGFGVVINTSFNLHGRTIVNTPSDALEDFLDSQMDFLILDGYWVRRRPV